MQQLVYYILNSRKADKKIIFFYLNVSHYMKAKDKTLNLFFFFFFGFLQISKISE